MIFLDAFRCNFPPRICIHGAADYAGAAVYAVCLAAEMFILCRDVVPVLLCAVSTQFSSEIPFVRPQAYLKCGIRIVAETVVDIVIQDGRPRAERNGASKVREKIESVMV